jgi:hypothetical protein
MKSIDYRNTAFTVFIMLFCFVACKSTPKPKTESTDEGLIKGVVLVHSETENKVDVFIDGEKLTSYMYPEDMEKPFLYPVYTARGTVITRGYPIEPREGERVDHPHHVGIWFNYGDVNGFDFWNNSFAVPEEDKIKYGKIVHREVLQATSKEEVGILKVTMDWMVQHDALLPAVSLLKEETRFEFRGDEQTRTIDRITTLTANTEDVVFTDNKEGLFAIRLDRAFEYPASEPQVFTDAEGNPSEVKVMDNEGLNGHYRSSTGVEDLEVWGKRADWVCLSATKGEEEITLAIFDHPGNPGYPASWHARGYGLFAVNNLGLKVFSNGKEELNFSLKKGESATFKHRFYITSGYRASDDELDKQFEEFSKK